MKFKQDVAFVNREKELAYMNHFIDKRPNEILFLHGPKSSGKTTLLFRFFDEIQKKTKTGCKICELIFVRTLSNYNNVKLVESKNNETAI
ncbi:MAG: hypothetical protein JJV92_00785 [Desulfosarcina sp.]|nr:hypothetical protein [Desulfobacterales bacterium]